MHISPTLTALLTLLPATLALPTLRPRAGGPTPLPIPTNCTISPALLPTFSLPNTNTTLTNSTLTPQNTTQTYTLKPSLNFTTTHQIYGYYTPPGTLTLSTWQTCLETCYGFGLPGTCRSAVMADQVPMPPLYGGPGGDPVVACLLFNGTLSDWGVGEGGNWTDAGVGTWTGLRTGSILC